MTEIDAKSRANAELKSTDDIRKYLVACGSAAEACCDVFTDGACVPNPGAGGWSFIIRFAGCPDVELFGGAGDTTNNRMEMTAVLQAMRALPQGVTGTIYSDSRYVIDGITGWMFTWQKNGWRRKPNPRSSASGEIMNLDIWQQIYDERRRKSVKFEWVRGHNGYEHNERADDLAEMGRVAFLAGEIEAVDIPPAVIPEPKSAAQTRMYLGNRWG